MESVRKLHRIDLGSIFRFLVASYQSIPLILEQLSSDVIFGRANLPVSLFS
jgi:hypothetical protein